MWAAELVVSLAMAALVSLKFARPKVAVTAFVLAALCVAAAWFATRSAAPRSGFTPPAPVAEASEAPPAPAAPAAHRARRKPRPPPPVNCIKVLTDPSQSTC